MKVTIDGQSIEVEPGTTILQARMIGGEVVPPAMCYYSKLKVAVEMPLLFSGSCKRK
jgi:NADH-quinone oxidoreductase subunit G